MAGLLGGGGNTVKTPKYTEINLQTSAQGVAIPIVYGQNRIGTNIIWYGGFKARTTKVGGKGGILGGGGKEYYYSADIILALCEGPIIGILQVWAGTTITNLGALGFDLFYGTADQAPWDYLVSKYPTQVRAYARTAYVAAADYQLGTSPDLPSHNFEVVGKFSGAVSGIPDVNFADVVLDYLTSPQYSIGMNTAALNAVDLANYKAATASAGIFGSPAQVNQEQVNQTLQRWGQLTNTWIFWSGNNLRFIPLFDSAMTGNGYTYTPQMSAIYDLDYDDFVPSSAGAPPVQVDIADPTDSFDRVQLNVLDRSNYYNNTPILWSDQVTVDELGDLQANIISATEICTQPIGQICAALIGKRALYVNRTYTFKLSRRFIFIEPGDIYTITDPNIGLNKFRVRITSVKSGTDRILTVTAENLPQGVGTVAAYNQQAAGAAPAYNPIVDPGNVNPPAIFEPSAALTGGSPEVWLGLSGGVNWGGAEVLLSIGGDVYSSIGTVSAGVLQGTLISTLAAHADPDTSDTLHVDLSECDGVLPSTATQADADALRTLILVDQEVMAYGTATPGTLNAYSSDMTYLRRGQYGTTIASHAAGAEFTRVDPALIFAYGLPQEYVGVELFFKFPSFNVFGGELQDASTLTPYTYTPVGTAFTLALPGTPVITSSRTVQADGTTILTVSASWSASAGPMLGSYETQWSVDGGTTWTNDSTVGAGAGGVVLTAAKAATNYLVRVRAISQNGSATSPWVVSAVTNSGNLVAGVPDAPTAIAAAPAAGAVMVTATPSDTAGTSGYQVLYGTSNVLADATLWPVSASSPAVLVSGLSAGTVYYFWMRAFNAAGASVADGPADAEPSGLSGESYFEQGTLLATGPTLVIDSSLTLVGTANPTLSFGGIKALLGSVSLGEFLTIDFGENEIASIVSGTLDLSGINAGTIGAFSGSISLGGFSAIDFGANEIASIVSGTLDLSGSNLGNLPVELAGTLLGSFSVINLESGFAANAGTGTNSGTLNLTAAGAAGTIGIYYDGTLYENIVARSNFIIEPGTGTSAGTLYLSASGGGGGGGSPVILNNGTSVGTAGTWNLAPGLYATITGDVAEVFPGYLPSTAYKYWRFLCTQNPSAPGGNIALSEIQFDNGSGTFSAPSGGTASSSSDYNGTSTPLAFDGSESTFWASSGTDSTDWIQYEFATAIGFANIRFAPRNDGYTAQAPINIVIQVSSDGAAFTNLATFTPATWNANVFQTVPV